MIFWISGTGMVQPIPKFWGQEWENTFTTFGDENGIENYIPNFGNGNHETFSKRHLPIPGIFGDVEGEW